MQTVTLTARAGSDGVLHLEVPVGMPNTDLEVVVVVHPRAPHPGWPPDFFDRVFGSIDDPSFVRHPQGEYEEREPLE